MVITGTHSSCQTAHWSRCCYKRTTAWLSRRPNIGHDPKLAEGVGEFCAIFRTVLQVALEFSDSEVKTS